MGKERKREREIIHLGEIEGKRNRQRTREEREKEHEEIKKMDE